jgi:hypothetical protein
LILGENPIGVETSKRGTRRGRRKHEQNVQSTINCFIDVGFDQAVLHRMAFVEATAYVESQAHHREERDEIDEEE